MDNFDKCIENYKRELLKYAKKNGNIFIGDNKGFKTADEIQEPTENKTPKKYKVQYVSNRPMPIEYSGTDENNDISVMANTVPQRPGEQSSPEPQTYKNYDDFIASNPKIGKLRVQTYAASQVFPIQNARVLVEKEFDDGRFTFKEEYTDIDGVADEIILPTKNKSLSLTPGEAIPYATYTVKVTHPQFSPITFHNVPIFESIESLQPVAMQPLSRPSVYEDVYEDAPNL
ncbi:MAG: hypothetical protein IJA87_05995 [Clostridia bacterium]|nr:hypothetical protein [Clostridia bacterium]